MVCFRGPNFKHSCSTRTVICHATVSAVPYTVVQRQWPTAGRRISRNPPVSFFFPGWRWKEEFAAWGNFFLVGFGSMRCVELQTVTVATSTRSGSGGMTPLNCAHLMAGKCSLFPSVTPPPLPKETSEKPRVDIYPRSTRRKNSPDSSRFMDY